MSSPSRFNTACKSGPVALQVEKMSALIGIAETRAARLRGPATQNSAKYADSGFVISGASSLSKTAQRFLFARLTIERVGPGRHRTGQRKIPRPKKSPYRRASFVKLPRGRALPRLLAAHR
jgi:hypothetical protein